MVDVEKLRSSVRHFESSAKPFRGSAAGPCTIEDIDKVIRETTRVLNAFIDELEHS